MSMYRLYRIIEYCISTSDKWSKYEFKISNDSFNLFNKELEALQSLKREYDYHQFPNVVFVDRTPSKVAEVVNNIDFIEDYTKNLTEKFFCAYLYEEVYE